MAQVKTPARKAAAKKPLKKKKHVLDPNTEYVTINKTCDVAPPSVTLGKNHKQQIAFHCGQNAGPFALLLNGGDFIGHPEDFALVVDGPDFVPNPPLQVDTSADFDDISNYVFDLSGNNCQGKAKDNPPDIIIDNS